MPKPNAEPGTYAIVFAADKRQTIQVGRLGTLDVRPGYYLYGGSALGPGRLAARVGRHCRQDKPHRWHVDYLRAVTKVEEVWYATGAERQECLWAATMGNMPGASVPMRGFGASDCRCEAHLFFFNRRPSARLRSQLAAAIGEPHARPLQADQAYAGVPAECGQQDTCDRDDHEQRLHATKLQVKG